MQQLNQQEMGPFSIATPSSTMVNCDPTKMMAVAGCSVMMGTANSPQPGAELVNLGWCKAGKKGPRGNTYWEKSQYT